MSWKWKLFQQSNLSCVFAKACCHKLVVQYYGLQDAIQIYLWQNNSPPDHSISIRFFFQLGWGFCLAPLIRPTFEPALATPFWRETNWPDYNIIIVRTKLFLVLRWSEKKNYFLQGQVIHTRAKLKMVISLLSFTCIVQDKPCLILQQNSDDRLIKFG